MTTTKKINLAFIVAVAVLALLLLAELIVVSLAHQQSKRTVENLYKSALYDLSDSVENLQVNASKLMVARGDGDSRRLITETYAHAEAAAQLIARLPLDLENSQKTVKFFNQVGDWCKSYGSAIDEGKSVDCYKSQTDDLFAAASSIAENLRKITQEVEEKGLYSTIGEDRILPYDFNLNVGKMNSSSVDYPELIYDGPFSDDKVYHFHALDGMNEISEDEARKRAESMGISVEQVYRTSGKIDEYYIHGTKNGLDVFVAFSVKGGLPMTYDYDRLSGAVKLDRKACERAAEQFAEKNGFGNMKAVWYNMNAGIAYVNLAPEIDSIIYYPDLIKVKLAADNGEVIGFECEGYCMNHCERNNHPTIDEGTARALVSPKLKIRSVRLAVIPSGQSEVLCYEIGGEYQGLDYFVYLDAHLGREINILRVVDNNQGSLTM